MTEDEEPSRLDNEIELLTAIYPDQASYSPKSRELKFTQDHATLSLRLPETYPEYGIPDVISATDSTRNDLRTQTKSAIVALNLPEGEEALDAIISAFQSLISESEQQQEEEEENQSNTTSPNHSTPKTVIIWLHHLLNTNKRKLCLSPPPHVSGITKPGYPGVLLYSGPTGGVTAHVNELKAQNWAAFQVRFEEDVEWRFGHGEGVREVESMADVVKLVEGGKGNRGGERQKEEFLKAVGIK
jgi:hypothetical protein